jgi:4-amino-4-deoxy-L-arabinose transferase-like glycosyltransferase
MNSSPEPMASTSSHMPRPGWLAVAVLVVLVFAAVFLRLWGISRESLDNDEIFSYRVATTSVSGAMHMIREDLVHPPLFYYLVRFSVGVGGANEFSLRFLSLAAAVGTIVLLVYMGYLFQQFRIAAWLAAVLLALNNTHIYYSQQARSAAFFTLMVCALLCWSWSLIRYQRNSAFWCAGAGLMTLLVYTHYVGAVYVACVAAGVALGMRSTPVAKRAVLAASVAAVTFLPWIVSEYSVYLQKKGLQENLGWTSSPSLYEVKLLAANYLGVPDIPGGTTIVFVLGCSAIAFGLLYRERTPLSRLVLSTLAFTAFVPPCLIFVLSQKPLSLPIFGERHLLPSIVSWLILAGYGVDRAAARFPVRARIPVFAAGAMVLVVLQIAPTRAAMRTAPRRLPYSDIARDVDGPLPLYTTSGYDIGDPVNFYLRGRRRVESLPGQPSVLPSVFTVMYRPAVGEENRKLTGLINSGWTVVEKQDYYNGIHSPAFVRAARLSRDPGSR